MKKFLCVLMVMLFSFCAVAEPADDSAQILPAGNLLGLASLQQAYVSGENAGLSPLSLALALALAREGASGDTLTALESIDPEGARSAEELKALCEALLEQGVFSANAVFRAEDLILLDSYADRISSLLGAEIFPLTDGAADDINAWVSENTQGLIDRLFDRLPESAGAVLINALALEADWMLPFLTEATYADVFFAPSGDVEADFMHKTGYLPYGEDENAQYICLPYSDSSLCMYIALPKDGSMDAFIENYCANGLDVFQMEEEAVYTCLSMPKFDLTFETDLTGILREMGAEAAFGAGADFSAMSETPLFISQVKQVMRIAADEQGTRAAAVTSIAMATSAMRNPEPVEMNINRPFVFAIADTVSGQILFTGIVNNPAE